MSTPTDPTAYLDALNWGASTGGAAGSAETTSTLGIDRIDTRVPPDATRLSLLSATRVKNLAMAMSQHYMGGTRLKVFVQTGNPFGASESGFWIDSTGVPRYSYNGSGGTLLTSLGGAVRLLNTSFGAFSATAASQQTSGANLTNNVTVGGTSDTIGNITTGGTVGTDIRDAIYQLARKVKQLNDGLRTYGLFT